MIRALLLSLSLLASAFAEERNAPEEVGLQLAPDALAPQPYAGISWSGVREAPAGSGYERGVVLRVVTGPAAASGLRVGDTLLAIGGASLSGNDVVDGDVIRQVIRLAGAGATVPVKVARGEDVQAIDLVLGTRPPRFDRYLSGDDWLEPTDEDASTRTLIEQAAAAAGAEAELADVRARLRTTELRRDLFRLRDVARAHANPDATEAIGTRVSSGVAADFLAASREVLVPFFAPRRTSPEGLDGLRGRAAEWVSIDEAVDDLETILVGVEAARAGLQPGGDEDELLALLPGLGSRLEETIYLHQDDDAEREAGNRRLVQQLESVRVARFLKGAALASMLGDPLVVSRLTELAAAHPDADRAIILSRETEAGLLEIAGRARNVHTKPAAFRFDLGGNDVYRDVAAAARQSVSICIDASGHDLYAATTEGGLAAAFFGVALLVDVEGDDQYLARRWGPAAAVGGVAILDDRGGNDVYRGQELGLGTALVGAALLLDRGGHDRYTAHHLAQGVGLARGLGALVDLGGDDEYVCTGRRPSSYGTAGVFDGWGQGLGLGFRTLASGGIGVLHDAAGDDRYEGGNFAQGGGYFFGMGILEDGAGDDRYIGSRYSQGFAAHQAVGVFVERAGNDLYQSHHSVAQGLSWDETTVVFHDHAGDDVYEASGFSLCRVAHNGFCLVRDDAGNDVYLHNQAPAGSSGNDYHGGSSFGLFVDSSGGDDSYRAPGRNDAMGWRQELGVFLDHAGEPGDVDWEALSKQNVFQP